MNSQQSTRPEKTCQSIDWYAEGEAKQVIVDGVVVTVRFVGRKGRRGRIAITAPSGTMFVDLPNGSTVSERA